VELTGGAGGGVVVDAVSTNAASGTFTSISIPHTTGAGADRLMLVGVAYEDEAPQTLSINGMNYGGNPLSPIGADIVGEVVVYIYAMLNPPSGTGTVQVSVSNAGATDGMVVGVMTFTGVNQITPLGPFESSTRTSGAAQLTIASAPGELVFSVLGLDNGNTVNGVGASQTMRWVRSEAGTVSGGGSTVHGAASVDLFWNVASAPSVLAAVSIKPAVIGTPSATFVQTPALCEPLSLPDGGQVTITNYISNLSGSMPATANVTARLYHGATLFFEDTTAAYNGSAGTLVWSEALSGPVSIPAGEAVSFEIVNNQVGVSFQVDFDSATRPSKVSLPTTTVIEVASLGVFDAPYPGGNLVSSPTAGSTLYIRTLVRDPFGSYDITDVDLVIDGPGTGADASATLDAGYIVDDDGCARVYEAVWSTGPVVGSFAVTVQANEGTEGIFDVAATSVLLVFQDLGTPSMTQFTAGNNGTTTNQFGPNQLVCVRVVDPDQNTNNAAADTVTVSVDSNSGDSETLVLTETGPDTGVFTACLPASTSAGTGADNGTLLAPAGSVLTATYTDPVDPLDETSATASVAQPPGLASLSAGKTLVAPSDGQAGIGESVTFALQLVNNGSLTLTNVTLTDTFPAANLAYVSASVPPDASGAGSLTWNGLGPLAPGQSVAVSVNFTALAVASPALNSAQGAADGIVTNNASAGVIITRSALTITKSLLVPAAGPVDIGSNVTFRVVVENTGTTAIESLPFEDQFSAGCFQFISASVNPDGAGAGSLLWTDLTGAGALAPAGSYTIDVTLQVTGGCDPAGNTARADYAVDANGDPVPPAVGTATVTTLSARFSGTVYDDMDQSGTLTAGDTGLPGVTMRLFTDPNGDGDPGDGMLVRQSTTLAGGSYEFLGLASGDYVVVEADLPGYASSSPVNNLIATNFTLFTTVSDLNFFDFQPSPTNYASASGTVWQDTNSNGVFDLGEPGLANVTVDLIQDLNTNGLVNAGEPVVASTLTATNGTYSFAAIIPGAYVIRDTDLFGWLSTGDSSGADDDQIGLLLAPGEISSENDFLNFFAGNNPGNDPPIAVNDVANTPEDTQVSIPVLVNDSDPDGDPLTLITVTTTNGVASVSGANVLFTPGLNYVERWSWVTPSATASPTPWPRSRCRWGRWRMSSS